MCSLWVCMPGKGGCLGWDSVESEVVGCTFVYVKSKRKRWHGYFPCDGSNHFY